MSVPDYVENPGPELEALLMSQHIQNPYPYPGNINVLDSYSAEPPESTYSRILREHAKHALAHSWKYDPFRCSVKGAFKLPQGLAGKPNHGLAKNEFNWTTEGKLGTLKKTRSAAQVDVKQARTSHRWPENAKEHDETHSLDGSDLDQELESFYGPDGTDLRPIDNDSDEGFSELDLITTTIISLPDKSLMEKGVTPGGIFQDSGISMDEGYAEYSLAHSLPSTAKETTRKVPSDWPTFNANVAPLRTPKQTGRWLGLVGDQKQCEWPGRHQGPYDLDGLHSHKKNQKLDGSSRHTTREDPIPARVTSTNESVKLAPEISDLVQNTGNSLVAFQSFGREQTSILHGDNENPITTEEAENNGPFIGAAHTVNIQQPQYSNGTAENTSEAGPSVPASCVISEDAQIDNNANDHVCRSIPNNPFATPLNQHIHHIQQAHIDTPATPEAITIHLTPEHNRDMNDDNASDSHYELSVPNSLTRGTQKSQIALDRYAQATKALPTLARRNSSAISLGGSESEEDPLTSSPNNPSQPEGHTGFRRAVELHQKENDAVFTLSPPKVPRNTPSPGKMAPIPFTPANRTDTAPFRPTTPFQLGTPDYRDLVSPGTPTPAPKMSNNPKGKSVMNVFRSPKLGSRSPEHAAPNSDVIVAPTTTPITGPTHPHLGSIEGSQGPLFHRAKKTERPTKNVLTSLKLTPEHGSGGTSEFESLDEYEDELAGPGVNPPPLPTPQARGGRKTAHPAVVVAVPRVRARDEAIPPEQEPQRKKKKTRR